MCEKRHKRHPLTLTNHLYVSGRAAEAQSWWKRVSCSSLNSATSPKTGPFGDLVSLNKCSSVRQHRLRQLLPLKQTNRPTTPLTAIRPSQLGQTTLRVTSCWKSLCVNAIKICCCFSKVGFAITATHQVKTGVCRFKCFCRDPVSAHANEIQCHDYTSLEGEPWRACPATGR